MGNFPITTTSDVPARHWRRSQTAKDAYKAFGISRNVNQLLQHDVEGIASELPPAEARQEVLSKLGIVDAETIKPTKKLIRAPKTIDKEYLDRLLKKYGTNYNRMSRDIKTNYWQYTPTQCRKKCQNYIRGLRQGFQNSSNPERIVIIESDLLDMIQAKNEAQGYEDPDFSPDVEYDV
eukprot:CAMPEP_0168526896 /NCGR_PEP_ID=MMETSP0405-20121227/12262_1 /TAXON_ID=498012 /ORGANISM="Trichosphaerium sp, Strain Am-I-7 wt" /LENGTH=177 /DNA_ID=CAMNT_0008549869 /DNA_START=97 /DNA_END=630 /DNA_ORIENTATION=+